MPLKGQVMLHEACISLKFRDHAKLQLHPLSLELQTES